MVVDASLPAELTLSWFLSCCTSSLIKVQIHTSHTSVSNITQLLFSEADKMLRFDWDEAGCMAHLIVQSISLFLSSSKFNSLWLQGVQLSTLPLI